MPQSEPERESRKTLNYSILAIPPSIDAKSVEKTEITRQSDLITSIGFKALILAGIANSFTTAAKKSIEVMDIFRTRFHKDIA